MAKALLFQDVHFVHGSLPKKILFSSPVQVWNRYLLCS